MINEIITKYIIILIKNNKTIDQTFHKKIKRCYKTKNKIYIHRPCVVWRHCLQFYCFGIILFAIGMTLFSHNG
jgi:hypothetical protein